VKFVLEEVYSPESEAFEEAYGALAAEFAPRGELERREVIERWLEARRTYHLLVARDEDGHLAGVRDCHVIVDRQNVMVTVYLAHALVLPPYRRSGLGGMLRRAPIALGQRVTTDWSDLLLVAEMERAVPTDVGSLIRLVAYGKEGFRVISPQALPYFQPDFSEVPVKALPLLAVVHWVDHEEREVLPKRLARALVHHLYTVFGTHVPASHLAELKEHMLAALDAFDSEEIPLLRLPRAIDDREALEPLR
jgi:GNAT superfamily N-acetyltransferase